MNGLTDMFESFALETMEESITDMVCEAQDMRIDRDLYLSAMESTAEDEELSDEEKDLDEAAMECGLDMELDLNLGFDSMNMDDKLECGTPDVSDADIANVSECDEAFVASVFDGTVSNEDMKMLEFEMNRVL